MRFIQYRNKPEVEENPFAFSIGDLMSALLFIFVLILSALMLQVKQQQAEDREITEDYRKVKQQLYIDLNAEFKDDLKSWDAIIDSTELSLRFQEPRSLFDVGKKDLQPRFQEILSDFFPRYIKLLSRKKYRNNIEEIRIEGHTDTDGQYMYNMRLSQERTTTVLEYCLNQIDKSNFKWVSSHITANGFSYSRPLLKSDGTEDKQHSRRVEFRIKTNAESKLEEIAKKRGLLDVR